jgi:hypothetical protein
MNEATGTIVASAGTILRYSTSAGQKWGAVLSALGLLALLYLVTAVSTRSFNPWRLVMGFDGRASTSKFQWFLWIAAIVFAYTALWVLRTEQGEFAALGVTSAGLLTVLGFSATTAIAAKGITSAYVRSGRVTKTAVADIGPHARGGILQDDSGAPELAKIQLVGFTLITIGIFLITVIHEIVTSPDLASLPNIDIFLVALIGISQAGYLGKKLVTADAPAWPAAALQNLPPTRSWNLIGLVAAALVVVVVVIAAVFGRPGLERTTSTGQWGGVLAFALLCSLISFAVLEMGKRLLPVRQFVQERYVLQWWITRAEAAVVPVEESWTELMEALDIGSSGRAVFGLPIQLLAAQVSNAADLALTKPERHPLLYFTLTRSADDVRELRNEFARGGGTASPPAPPVPADESGPATSGESGPAASGDQELLAAVAAQWKQTREPGSSARDLPLLRTSAGESQEDSQSFQAGQRARSAIDSLQLAVGERWRRSVQAAAVIGAALAGLLIQLARPSESRWLYVLAAALIGGSLAWTIRDLAASIERWRRLCRPPFG